MANVAMDLRIGILGPLEVRVGFGEPVQVVGPRLRALLIRLAMEPDRVVLAGQLIDAVWDADPPAAATGALQSLVSRLRRLLPEVVESQAAGYRLAVDPDSVDSVRFERLALSGRGELRRDPWRARELLGEALALWRGPALADVATARFAGAAVARLEELRLGAIEDRIEAELATGSGQRLAAGHADRPGRLRQDPAGHRGGRHHARSHARRGLARRARAGGRPRRPSAGGAVAVRRARSGAAGAPGARPQPGAAAGADRAGDRRQAPAAGDGQLRAPGRACRRADRRAAGPLPGAAGAGDQPRAAGDHR